MIARILTGRLADSVGPLETFAVSMTLAGIVTALLPLLTSFEALIVYSIFFGFFGGAFVGLYSVVTAVHFGGENLPSAIGVVMCSWCLGTFIGAPMSGWIYDSCGTYTPAWILCGACMTLSGVMCMVLPMIDAMYPERLYRPAAKETCSPPPTKEDKDQTIEMSCDVPPASHDAKKGGHHGLRPQDLL